MSANPTPRLITVHDFLSARARGVKLTVLTAYDYSTARLLDETGVDCILVGDSLGMVMQGNPHCLTVTLDEMIYHSRCVARAVKHALIVTDMPFMTYQVSVEEAIRNAGRLVQEGGAHTVKLEGGVRVAKTIETIVKAQIPVMGHVGMTPQSVQAFGGFRVQRDEQQILDDAKAVADAGAFAVVLECIPAELAARITESLPIPTIGIGAGLGCDGQVLVIHDLLGLYDEIHPKFVKRYAELGAATREAVRNYCAEVRSGEFPKPEHEFK
jgi:3-methyl-2-oxobutanoate hydroxymethyltransferase